MNEPSKRQQLLDDGFCVFPGLLDGDLLERLRLASDRLLDAYPEEERQRRGNQGSVVSILFQERAFVELIAWPPVWAALRELGFDGARYWSGSVISKEAHSTSLYWHQDWVWWREPESADPVPHQLFLMWYLTDTRPENGCLRVLPQSHRRRLEAHDLIGSHDDGIRHRDPATTAGYQALPGEVDVPVTAGDLVVGDSRVLHAAHANTTDRRRTVLTTWYLPRYDELSERLRSAYQKAIRPPSASLPADELALIQPLLPDYRGDAEPAHRSYELSDYLQPAARG
ncbi:MAG: phytanoyl-CoA dioxygenase family protein [Spirochaetaceae bacterium]|nr:phytanoyl-CoA dioxygenase family protein [Spirochaetaceae bacterium]